VQIYRLFFKKLFSSSIYFNTKSLELWQTAEIFKTTAHSAAFALQSFSRTEDLKPRKLTKPIVNLNPIVNVGYKECVC
jgi:hypothetical protein